MIQPHKYKYIFYSSSTVDPYLHLPQCLQGKNIYNIYMVWKSNVKWRPNPWPDLAASSTGSCSGFTSAGSRFFLFNFCCFCIWYLLLLLMLLLNWLLLSFPFLVTFLLFFFLFPIYFLCKLSIFIFPQNCRPSVWLAKNQNKKQLATATAWPVPDSRPSSTPPPTRCPFAYKEH